MPNGITAAQDTSPHIFAKNAVSFIWWQRYSNRVLTNLRRYFRNLVILYSHVMKIHVLETLLPLLLTVLRVLEQSS